MKNILTFLLCLFAVTVFGKSMVGTNEVTELKAFDPSQFSTNSGATKQVRIKAGAIALTNLDSSLSNSVYSSVTITNVGSLFVGDTNGFVMTGGGNAKAVTIQPGTTDGITNHYKPDMAFDGQAVFNDLVTISNAAIFRRAVTSVPLSSDKWRLAAGTNAINILEFYSPGLGTLLSAINTNGNFTGAAAQASHATNADTIYRFDVVANYHGSGDTNTPGTASISSGSRTLTVSSATNWSAGMGILVYDAGTEGRTNSDLLTIVTNVSGNTLGLSNAASATVSGATFKHDDTFAIRAAIAAAATAGGDTVWLQPGYYGCAGFRTNSYGIIDFPQNHNGGVSTRVDLIGSGRGNTALYFGDAPYYPTGPYPSFISLAPYVYDPAFNETNWNSTELHIDALTIDGGVQTKYTAINMGNAKRGAAGSSSGSTMGIYTSADARTNDTYGIIYPQAANDEFLTCGMIQFYGFHVGIMTGEHLRLYNPHFGAVTIGMRFNESYHGIVGDFTAETCNYFWDVATNAQHVTIDLHQDSEDLSTGTYNGIGCADTNSIVHGELRYVHWVFSGDPDTLSFFGATNLTKKNLRTGAISGPQATPAFTRVPTGYEYALTTSFAAIALTGGGSQFTLTNLAAGTYFISANVYLNSDPALYTVGDVVQAKLYNTTDAADIGPIVFHDALNVGDNFTMHLDSVVVLSATKTINVLVKNAGGARGTVASYGAFGGISYIKLQ